MAEKEKFKKQNGKNEEPVRLYRSEKNRVIAGVAGGLGDFFNVDATLIRLIFILITIFGGGGILLYLILWLIIPNETAISEISKDSIRQNAKEIKIKAHDIVKEFKFDSRRTHSRHLFALIIIILGVMFLFDNLGLIKIFNYAKLWPILLIIIGVAILSRRE
jgi:phage shock protein C